MYLATIGGWRLRPPAYQLVKACLCVARRQGGKWFSLVDKAYSSENLRASWEKVKSNGGAAGVDRRSIEAYEKEAEKNLVEPVCVRSRTGRLEKILREGNYRAKPAKRVWIPKIGSKEK